MTDYEKVCDFQNLYKAHKKARLGKRKKADVIDFEMNLATNLWEINRRLTEGMYRVAGYNRFMIKEPKEREIQALNYPDRIVQHRNGIDYLGWHFYLADSGKVIRKLRTQKLKKLKRRLKGLQKGYREGRLNLGDIKRSMASTHGHLKHGHTYYLRKKLNWETVFCRSAAD